MALSLSLTLQEWISQNITTGSPSSPPTGVFAYTVDWSHHRCWTTTSSPTGLPSSPPTGVFAYTVGWSHHRCWASTSSPTGLPSSPPTGVSACTAGLLCRHCWASTSSPTGRLVRRRLVSPPARLAFYAALVGRLHLHLPACLRRCRLVFPPARLAFMPPLLGVYVLPDRLAFAAAGWCLRPPGRP